MSIVKQFILCNAKDQKAIKQSIIFSYKQLNIFMIDIIIVSLLPVMSQCCDTLYKFDHSRCFFNINYVDDACTTFDLTDCSWQLCDSWVNTGHTSTCVSYSTLTNSSWNTCTQTCCSSTNTYRQTTDSLKQCDSLITSSYNKTVIIICSTIGIFFFLFGIWLLYYYTLKSGPGNCSANFRESLQKYSCCRYFLSNIDADETDPKNNIDANLSLTEMTFWKEAESKPLPNGNSCSVCLDAGCFFELQCHHTFHRQCIITCLKKKRQCILCRSTSIQKIRVYCQECFQFYYVTSLAKTINLSNHSKQVCDHCNKIQVLVQ